MASKKLRFRGDLNFQNRIDDLYDEVDGAAVAGFSHRRSSGSVNTNNKDSNDTAINTAKESEAGEKGKLCALLLRKNEDNLLLLSRTLIVCLK